MTFQRSKPVYFLLVDDLAENLVALDALLRRPGLEILKACSGHEALELLLAHEVALAIIDVQMPGMNGFELAELMRGTERTRRVPIIFVTAGSADRQRRFRGYETGAVDFLAKPIEPDILRSKAEVFFDLFCQRQEVAAQRDELQAAADRIQSLLQESQQQAEALREADQRKDEFLATLAHELRNPLAPIRNAIEILSIQRNEADELSEPVEIARRQIQHMARLIEDLLDVARIAKGKIELRMALCDVVEIVRNTAEDYRPTLDSAGITLDINSQIDRLPVHGDAIRIAQMVGNLLHNAGKFTSEGGKVIVSVAQDTETEQAVISVIDSGIGFAMADAARLFEPFSQGISPDGDRKGGLGLGLALTKGLAELHQGTVSAESGGRGEGATFTLRLPTSMSINKAGQLQKKLSDPADARLSILVIEDNTDSAKSLQMLLSLHGHRVDIAHDGSEGLVVAKSNRPDVVISDLGLPGIDGYALAKQIKSDPCLRSAYLVALSGYGREDDRKRTREAGFDEHLVKPVEMAALKRVLADASTKLNHD
jgi:signal transduction histidine kinase